MNALALLLTSLLSAGSVSEVVVFPDRALVVRTHIDRARQRARGAGQHAGAHLLQLIPLAGGAVRGLQRLL